MFRRNFLATILAFFTKSLFAGRPKSFVITDHDVSGFVVTDHPSLQEKRVVTEHNPGVHEDDKIFLYSATWCGPCRAAKEALAKIKDKPFVLDIVDVDAEKYPPGFDKLPTKLQTIPHFEWNTPNGRVYTKWKDYEDLVGKWLLSKQRKNLTYTDVQVQEGYKPKWTWPGKLADHLRLAHGKDVGALSQDQMELLHDELHGGTSK